jgi:inhibitor of KinA
MALAARPAGARIVPLGDRALIIEVGDRIAPDVNRRARAIAEALLAAPPSGVTDVVPAFATVGVHFLPEAVEGESTGELPLDRLMRVLQPYLARADDVVEDVPRTVELPICYGGEYGPDLAEVATACGVSEGDVAALHAASSHFVYMLGFAPGHPYIGGLDKRLTMPRRTTPRVRLPRGTVAIALEMTAIYPLDSPGGWNAIGRTPLPLFVLEKDPPCLLQPGDRVRFVPITPAEYRAIEESGG